MKRKIIYLMISLSVFLLYGCADKDKETNFIPTPTVTEEDAQLEDETSEDTTDDTEETEEPSETAEETDFTGRTTTKYVKLEKYDGILNIRSTPSKDGEIVGFLVHTEKVDVIGIEDEWASIVYQDKKCYVSADFLVDVKPELLTPPTPTQKPAKPTPTPIPDPTAEPPEI